MEEIFQQYCTGQIMPRFMHIASRAEYLLANIQVAVAADRCVQM